MFARWTLLLVAAITCILSFAGSAESWTHGAVRVLAINCPTQNTTEFTVKAAVVLANCSINEGYYGAVLVSVTGQVTCGPLSDAGITLAVGTGPYPTYPGLGASFNGSITGGILTISSMVTSSPPYNIEIGQTLFDASSGSNIPGGVNGSTLTIIGQTDATHYTVSNSGITVGSEQMWSLNVATGKPPSSIQISKGIIEHLACQNGKTFIVNMSGVLPNNDLSTNLNIWASVLLTSESIAGHNSQSASWNNGQITMVALAKYP